MCEITCIVCPHVFAELRPVRLLIRYDDGTWQATCGERDHIEDCSDFEIIGVNHLFDRQADLKEVAALLPNTLAEQAGEGWKICPFDESN